MFSFPKIRETRVHHNTDNNAEYSIINERVRWSSHGRILRVIIAIVDSIVYKPIYILAYPPPIFFQKFKSWERSIFSLAWEEMLVFIEVACYNLMYEKITLYAVVSNLQYNAIFLRE